MTEARIMRCSLADIPGISVFWVDLRCSWGNILSKGSSESRVGKIAILGLYMDTYSSGGRYDHSSF